MYGFDFSKEPRAIREAREEGRKEIAIAIITGALKRHLKQELPEEIRSRLTDLSLPVLEDLCLALVDSNSLEELESWISLHSSSGR